MAMLNNPMAVFQSMGGTTARSAPRENRGSGRSATSTPATYEPEYRCTQAVARFGQECNTRCRGQGFERGSMLVTSINPCQGSCFCTAPEDLPPEEVDKLAAYGTNFLGDVWLYDIDIMGPAGGPRGDILVSSWSRGVV